MLTNNQPSESKQRSPRVSAQNNIFDEFIVNQKSLNRLRVKETHVVRWSWSIRDEARCPLFKEALILAAKQAKFIQEFHIELVDFSDENLCRISRSLKDFSSLKNFSLKISYRFRISDRGLYYLSKALKKLSGLESLDFCFHGFSNITNKGLEILSKTFGMHIFSLKNIRLCFIDCYGLIDVLDLTKGLKKLVSLQKFILELAPCDDITNEGMLSLKKPIQELKSFQKVDIYFGYHPKISFSQAVEIIQIFESLPSLQNIAIDFDDGSRSIINFQLHHLAQGVENLMIFFDANFPFQLMKSEFGVLVRFPALKSLFLQFEPIFEMNDFQLKSLCQNLKYMMSLQNLTLKFFICPQITDEGLESLSQSLSPLTEVKHLDLEFLTCLRITDKGLKCLSQSLKERLALRNLRLHFRCCKQITDEGIYFLSKSVESLVYLQNADFDFSYISKISDLGMQCFAGKLKKLVGLKEVTLWFLKAKEIGDYVKQIIIEDLKNHVSLQRAYLNFGEKRPMMIEVWNERIHLAKEKQLRPSFSYLLSAGLMNCLEIGKLAILGGLDFQENSEFYDRVNKALLLFSLYQ